LHQVHVRKSGGRGDDIPVLDLDVELHPAGDALDRRQAAERALFAIPHAPQIECDARNRAARSRGRLCRCGRRCRGWSAIDGRVQRFEPAPCAVGSHFVCRALDDVRQHRSGDVGQSAQDHDVGLANPELGAPRRQLDRARDRRRAFVPRLLAHIRVRKPRKGVRRTWL
jgi:hypothetical protein